MNRVQVEVKHRATVKFTGRVKGVRYFLLRNIMCHAHDTKQEDDIIVWEDFFRNDFYHFFVLLFGMLLQANFMKKKEK